MIISISRRTDIPAFYTDWFMNRIRAGFVHVRNPFNIHQLQHVSLAVKDVSALVFWTRNAEKLLRHLPELDARGYRYYFQYTITGYPKTLEKSTPDLHRAISTFRELSERVGPERVLWRYDPILISNVSTIDQHLRRFAAIASALRGATRRVTISFAEFYRKTLRNLRLVQGLSVTDITHDPNQLHYLSGELARIAAENGIQMRSCAVDIDLADAGILPGKCIDDQRLGEVFGLDSPGKKDNSQRSGCSCVKSIDIGQYSTCLHGCRYCYATSNHRQAQANETQHDPDSSVLIGPEPDDMPEMYRKPEQLRLF